MESHDLKRSSHGLKLPEVRRGAGPFGVVAKGLEVPWNPGKKVGKSGCLRKVAESYGLW